MSMTVQDYIHDCWNGTQDLAIAVGQAASEAAVIGGTWVVNNSIVAATWIRDTSIFAGTAIANAAVFAGTTIAKAAIDAGTFVVETAIRAYEISLPVIIGFGKEVQKNTTEAYQFVRDFISAHPNETVVGLAAFTVGALTAFILAKLC